ncbi:MAG: hypothetical protein V3V02_01290 [Rhizobiaceae bacterium]
MAAMFAVVAGQTAHGQTARKFGKKAITVRLCPTNCTKVTGHGYKPGGSTTVYETKGGWARVSGYIKRSELVKSFGNKITKKPALWVPVSSLKTVKKKVVAKKKKPVVKKKVSKKKTVKKRRVARLSRTPLPIFRPNSAFTTSVPVVVNEPTVVEQSVVEQPVMEPAVKVVESTPVTPKSQETGSKGALTWEQVQAKIAAQKNNANTNSASATAKVAAAMKAAAAKKVTDAAKVAAAKKAADAAKVAAAKKTADAAKVATAKKTADAAKVAAAKKTADAAKVAAAKKTADAAKVAAAKKTADAAKVAAAKKTADAAKVAAAKKTADAAKAAAVKKTADAAKKQPATVSEEQRVAAIIAKNKAARIAAEASRKTETPKVNAKKPAVGYQPPKPEDTTVAVVLPPKEVAATDAPTAKQPTSEPVYKSAKADPIVFGKRPKKYIKALRDKRLRKLPGSKSGVRKDVVIALRHYALGLLKSGECKGISKGGPSTTPGMLYVICTDDLTYLRQFPLKEESW